jgi:hypothetical protein
MSDYSIFRERLRQISTRLGNISDQIDRIYAHYGESIDRQSSRERRNPNLALTQERLNSLVRILLEESLIWTEIGQDVEASFNRGRLYGSEKTDLITSAGNVAENIRTTLAGVHGLDRENGVDFASAVRAFGRRGDIRQPSIILFLNDVVPRRLRLQETDVEGIMISEPRYYPTPSSSSRELYEHGQPGAILGQRRPSLGPAESPTTYTPPFHITDFHPQLRQHIDNPPAPALRNYQFPPTPTQQLFETTSVRDEERQRLPPSRSEVGPSGSNQPQPTHLRAATLAAATGTSRSVTRRIRESNTLRDSVAATLRDRGAATLEAARATLQASRSTLQSLDQSSDGESPAAARRRRLNSQHGNGNAYSQGRGQGGQGGRRGV